MAQPKGFAGLQLMIKQAVPQQWGTGAAMKNVAPQLAPGGQVSTQPKVQPWGADALKNYKPTSMPATATSTLPTLTAGTKGPAAQSGPKPMAPKAGPYGPTIRNTNNMSLPRNYRPAAKAMPGAPQSPQAVQSRIYSQNPQAGIETTYGPNPLTERTTSMLRTLPMGMGALPAKVLSRFTTPTMYNTQIVDKRPKISEPAPAPAAPGQSSTAVSPAAGEAATAPTAPVDDTSVTATKPLGLNQYFNLTRFGQQPGKMQIVTAPPVYTGINEGQQDNSKLQYNDPSQYALKNSSAYESGFQAMCQRRGVSMTQIKQASPLSKVVAAIQAVRAGGAKVGGGAVRQTAEILAKLIGANPNRNLVMGANSIMQRPFRNVISKGRNLAGAGAAAVTSLPVLGAGAVGADMLSKRSSYVAGLISVGIRRGVSPVDMIKLAQATPFIPAEQRVIPTGALPPAAPNNYVTPDRLPTVPAGPRGQLRHFGRVLRNAPLSWWDPEAGGIQREAFQGDEQQLRNRDAYMFRQHRLATLEGRDAGAALAAGRDPYAGQAEAKQDYEQQQALKAMERDLKYQQQVQQLEGKYNTSPYSGAWSSAPTSSDLNLRARLTQAMPAPAPAPAAGPAIPGPSPIRGPGPATAPAPLPAVMPPGGASTAKVAPQQPQPQPVHNGAPGVRPQAPNTVQQPVPMGRLAVQG